MGHRAPTGGSSLSYRRALVARWSHRDRLAVLVVAVTVGFLVGTTLLVLGDGPRGNLDPDAARHSTASWGSMPRWEPPLSW